MSYIILQINTKNDATDLYKGCEKANQLKATLKARLSKDSLDEVVIDRVKKVNIRGITIKL